MYEHFTTSEQLLLQEFLRRRPHVAQLLCLFPSMLQDRKFSKHLLPHYVHMQYHQGPAIPSTSTKSRSLALSSLSATDEADLSLQTIKTINQTARHQTLPPSPPYRPTTPFHPITHLPLPTRNSSPSPSRTSQPSQPHSLHTRSKSNTENLFSASFTLAPTLHEKVKDIITKRLVPSTGSAFLLPPRCRFIN